jgi:hypothetical protein
MKSVHAVDEKQMLPSKKSENGNRQWIIFILLVLAVFSILAFFVLSVIVEKVP